jgi:hypothetical protein
MPCSYFPSENKSTILNRPDKSMIYQTESEVQPRKVLKEKMEISQAIP